jgi:deoxyribonuclease V
MNYQKLHTWQVDLETALQVQHDLAERIITENGFDHLHTIAGCDVAYSTSSNQAFVAISIFDVSSIEKIYEVQAVSEVSFPYIRGLFTFREGPLLLKAFEKLNERPDVVIFNGLGIAHPRRMGLATHMGILLDIPSIGCTLRSMYGKAVGSVKQRGDWDEIQDTKNEIMGCWLTTRKGVRPVFISQGHKIDLSTAREIILGCTRNYKLPEPLRAAHLAANRLKAKNQKKTHGKS